MGQDQVSGGVSVLCWLATPVANVLWKPTRNKVITSKTIIRSSSVTRSRFSEMSDQRRVSLYMTMSQKWPECHVTFELYSFLVNTLSLLLQHTHCETGNWKIHHLFDVSVKKITRWHNTDAFTPWHIVVIIVNCCTFLFCLQSIVAHWNHFVRWLSVLLSVHLSARRCVWLSSSVAW